MKQSRLLELAGVDKKVGVTIRLEKDTEANTNFRQVVHTGTNFQLVLMSLTPNQEIGMETHEGEQFIRIDKGSATAIMDGKESTLSEGDAVIIPEGVKHNIINSSNTENLSIYAIYSPPEHKDGHIDKTKPTVD